MPRISPVTLETAPESTKPILEQFNASLGRLPNFFGTLGHSAAATNAFVGLKEAIAKGSLGDSLGESLAMAIATESSCGYCQAAHNAIGKMVGVSDEERQKNLAGQSDDPRTQAAITFAQSVVEKRGWADDADVQAVRDAGFSDSDILEIVTIVSLNLFTNYVNHLSGTEIDFPKVEVGESANA